MEREDIKSRKEMYLVGMKSAGDERTLTHIIMIIISIVLILFHNWGTLAVLFFSYSMGSYSQKSSVSWKYYSDKLDEEIEKEIKNNEENG